MEKSSQVTSGEKELKLSEMVERRFHQWNQSVESIFFLRFVTDVLTQGGSEQEGQHMGQQILWLYITKTIKQESNRRT